MRAAVQPFPFAEEFRGHAGALRCRDELELEVAELRAALAAAREEGRAEGVEQALAAMQGERDTALLAATEAMVSGLEALGRQFAETEQAVALLGAGLALDFADHLAGRAVERDPALAIDRAIARALEAVRRGQPVVVRVAPDLVPAIESAISMRQSEDRRRLRIDVAGDPAIASGDARIDWDAGAMLLDREQRRMAIEAEIAAMLAA